MILSDHVVISQCRRHTPALNTHDITICYVRGCNTLLQEKINSFCVCKTELRE